eukprot:814870-Pelagomonas_calceolata.AAC.8
MAPAYCAAYMYQGCRVQMPGRNDPFRELQLASHFHAEGSPTYLPGLPCHTSPPAHLAAAAAAAAAAACHASRGYGRGRAERRGPAASKGDGATRGARCTHAGVCDVVYFKAQTLKSASLSQPLGHILACPLCHALHKLAHFCIVCSTMCVPPRCCFLLLLGPVGLSLSSAFLSHSSGGHCLLGRAVILTSSSRIHLVTSIKARIILVPPVLFHSKVVDTASLAALLQPHSRAASTPKSQADLGAHTRNPSTAAAGPFAAPRRSSNLEVPPRGAHNLPTSRLRTPLMPTPNPAGPAAPTPANALLPQHLQHGQQGDGGSGAPPVEALLGRRAPRPGLSVIPPGTPRGPLALPSPSPAAAPAANGTSPGALGRGR